MTAAPHQPGSLSGRSVLVVEDEFFQAKDLAQALANAGARLVGPFPSLKTAMEALKEEPSVDVPVLDINLRGRAVYEVADLLAERGIPFLFATGYDVDLVPAKHQGRPFLTKPFRIESLLAAVASLCSAPSGEGGQQQARQLS